MRFPNNLNVSDIGIAMAVAGTPLKTWCMLGVMILFGVRSLKTQVIYPPNLLLIPAILMCFKFSIFFNKAPYLYIGTLSLGAMAGLITAKRMAISWQRHPKRLVLPGSPSTLCILMTFFCIKYGYQLLCVLNPGQAVCWVWLDTGISGLLPGYTWAKGLFFCYQYFYRRSSAGK